MSDLGALLQIQIFFAWAIRDFLTEIEEERWNVEKIFKNLWLDCLLRKQKLRKIFFENFSLKIFIKKKKIIKKEKLPSERNRINLLENKNLIIQFRAIFIEQDLLDFYSEIQVEKIFYLHKLWRKNFSFSIFFALR